MQTNPRFLTLVLATLLSHGIVATEPTYQGKTAAGWINRVVEDRTFDNSKAIEALREIGPNAVPPLVQLFNQIASWNKERSKQTNGGAFDQKWSYYLPAFACRALEEQRKPSGSRRSCRRIEENRIGGGQITLVARFACCKPESG